MFRVLHVNSRSYETYAVLQCRVYRQVDDEWWTACYHMASCGRVRCNHPSGGKTKFEQSDEICDWCILSSPAPRVSRHVVLNICRRLWSDKCCCKDGCPPAVPASLACPSVLLLLNHFHALPVGRRHQQQHCWRGRVNRTIPELVNLFFCSRGR